LWTPQSGGPPDPEQMMDRFTTWELTSKANRWQGRNVYRWRSEDYDRLYRSVQSEFDPVKRASLFIEMNNLLIKERVIIPVVWRADVLGLNNKIRANLSPWDSPFWQLHDWYREA
jgi:peptide/nickel transport system substrate-binding protein